MAVFASTTIPYSAPNQALTLKALEKRQADLLAQTLKGGAITPENTQTPIQGIGHVMNSLGDSFREQRGEQALAARRAELANVMANIGPGGPTPQQQAQVIAIDPDIGTKLMQQAFEARQQTGRQDFERSQQSNLFGQQKSQAEARVEAEKAAAAEKARLDQEAASQVAANQEEARRQQAREAEINDARDAENKLKEVKLAAEIAAEKDRTDPKKVEARGASETKYRQALSHIQGLDKAISILTDNPEGEAIHTGIMQSVAPGASGIPGVNMFVDKAKAARTAEYNSIVGGDAIKEMSSTLTGATTNFELQKFENMRNNPAFTDKQRAEQLQRVKEAAIADAETMRATSEAMGGKPSRVEQAMKPQAAPVPGSNAPASPAAAATAPDQNAAARAWLEANPNDPRAAAVRQKLGIK